MAGERSSNSQMSFDTGTSALAASETRARPVVIVFLLPACCQGQMSAKPLRIRAARSSSCFPFLCGDDTDRLPV